MQRYIDSRIATSLAACLILFMPCTAIAQQGTPERRALPEDLSPGEMLWQAEEGWRALPLLDVKVELAVTGILSRARVTQRFANPTEETIDATYVFPLAERAIVDSLELHVGDRSIRSTIQEKKQARRSFEAARQTGRKAALLESRRPNLFTTRVAGINPGETLEVVFEYLDRVDFDGERFRLSLPMTYIERYGRDGGGGSGGGETRTLPGKLPLVELRVELRMGIELEAIDSASHELEIVEAEDAVHVTIAGGAFRADRDFLLEVRPRLGLQPEPRLLVESGYALAMLYPPSPSSDLALGLPTETLFVIDVSGSMDGPSIVQARHALVAALRRLRAEDRFNVMAFNQRRRLFHPGFRQAEAPAIAEAVSWVEALRADGGTEIAEALSQGLSLAGESRSSRAQRIVFLTDGAVDAEMAVLSMIARQRGELRLHAIGIGDAPNRYLLRKMAELGRGLCEFIATGESGSNRIAEFLERVDRPLVTGLSIAWEGMELDELYPSTLPDMHVGQSWAVVARVGTVAPQAGLRLNGRAASGWFERETRAQRVGGPSSGISKRWARAKVDSILDEQHRGRDPQSVRREIVALALEHQIVTRHTSLVAVDDRPTTSGRAGTVQVAGVLPRGATDAPLRRLLALIFLAAGAAGCWAIRR